MAALGLKHQLMDEWAFLTDPPTFTIDVVGYSRPAGADEERTLARLSRLRSDLIGPPSAPITASKSALPSPAASIAQVTVKRMKEHMPNLPAALTVSAMRGCRRGQGRSVARLIDRLHLASP
jgi:hypothetical protein